MSRPHSGRSGLIKINPGSRKRLRHITLRGNWTVGMWIWLVFMAMVIFGLIPWLMRLDAGHSHRLGAPDRGIAPLR
jgi:hypothetical protein